VYFALTAEANLNVRTPAVFLPVATAHELAHSRGIAAEDQANFAAVIVCLESFDPTFRYSGYLSGFTALGNALSESNRELYLDCVQELGESARLDISDASEYWKRYEDAPAAVAAVTVYDGYLKSNNQPLGIRTYGECVTLLAEWVRKST
jgi:hypothetical protein